MGRRVSFVNDIQILQEMLSPCVQVSLQLEQGRPSVELIDSQSGTNVKIKGVPPDSIVIRAEIFEEPLIPFLNNYIPFATFVKYLKFVIWAIAALV